MLEAFRSDLAGRGVSAQRQRDSLRLLRDFESWLGNRSLLDAGGDDLAAFRAHRRNAGYAPNTLRKERHMALGFFGWAFDAGRLSADALLSVRAVATPAAASSQPRPEPYSRKELQR